MTNKFVRYKVGYKIIYNLHTIKAVDFHRLSLSKAKVTFRGF